MAVSRRIRTAGSTDRPRQLPGPACEECRKRRVRCDRQRPQCGTCAEADVVCEVTTTRLARGPKKGDLKALRSRVVALERRLSLEQSTGEGPCHGITPTAPFADAVPAIPEAPVSASSVTSVSDSSGGEYSQFSSPSCQRNPSWDSALCVQMTPMTPASLPAAFAAFQFPPSPPSPSSHAYVDGLMCEDLDQLYFERVHPNVPIFNRTRYISRSRQINLADTPKYMQCLQSAMWTIAMAFSSQFESLRHVVYSETRQMLEALDLDEGDMGSVRVEHVQAYLLLAFYEFARSNYRRAWVTSGRAFRLVQLAKLHLLDSGEHAAEGEDPVSREERRRTFWVAYYLDHLLSTRNRCPLTLAEEVICTRLPSPDLAFQSGHPIEGYFMSDAIASGDHSLLSPLAESAILVTICDRALRSQRHRAYGGAFLDFSVQHDMNWWLNGMVASLPLSGSGVSGATDPMNFFALMMAHFFRILLCELVESMRVDGGPCHLDLLEYQNQALQAAREIARLAKTHEHIGYVKAHIFLPLAISLAAGRLMAHARRSMDSIHSLSPSAGGSQEILQGGNSIIEGELQYCMDALRKIKCSNNLARDHLSVLESQQEFALCV